MQIKNETLLPTVVLREHLDDAWGHLVAISKATYEVRGGGLALARDQVPVHRDPCDDAPAGEVHFMVEPGLTDITCVGEVCAPRGEPAVMVDVRLCWGDQVRALRAFGRRVWRRDAAGKLAATAPEPFTTLPMAWSHAFGGTHRIPAGFAPHTRLPMPAGELGYAANRRGMGFYFEEERAEGAPLPHLEDPSALVQSPADRPAPACFAPVPIDSLLRGEHIEITEDGEMRSRHGDQEMVFPRVLQNAPPPLQARGIGPGTRISLEGMTPDGPFEFTVPDPGVVWIATTGKRSREARTRIAGIQLRPGERRVLFLLRTNVYYPLVRGERREARLVPASPAPIAPRAEGGSR